jgi:hypothetical protein
VHGTLAAPLGVVHRHVGVAQHDLRGAHRLVGERDPDAGSDHDRAAADVHRFPQGDQEPVRHLQGRLVLRALQQDGELVPAQPRRGVPCPQEAGEAVSDDVEHLVAGVVAESVVDGLEVVEVDEADGARRAVVRATAEGVLHPLAEEHPVADAGEVVVERAVPEVALEGLAVGDVVGVEDDADDRGLVPQVGHGQLERLLGAVGRRDPELGRAARAPQAGEHRQLAAQHGAIVLVDDPGQAVAQQLLRGVTEDVFRGRAHVCHRAVVVEDGDDVARVLGQRPEAGLAALEDLAGRHPVGDLAGVEDRAGHGGIALQLRDGGLEPARAALGVEEAELEGACRPPGVPGLLDEREQARPVVGVEQRDQLGRLAGQVAVPQQALGGRAHERHPAVLDHDHDVGGVLDERPEAGLAAATVQVGGQRGRLEGQRHVGGERLQGVDHELAGLGGHHEHERTSQLVLAHEGRHHHRRPGSAHGHVREQHRLGHR